MMHNDSLFKKSEINSHRGLNGSVGTPRNVPHQASQISVQNLPKPVKKVHNFVFATNKWSNLPGICFKIMGEFLQEKLPLIIFTNRVSFRTSLSFQIEEYDVCLSQVN